MLTIKNIEILRNKVLGNSNFYVESICSIFDLDPKGYNIDNHRYQIDITNRTYSKTIMLNREPKYGTYYKLFSSEEILYLKLDEIKDMDVFILKLKELC
jgi:hypothetical protein